MHVTLCGSNFQQEYAYSCVCVCVFSWIYSHFCELRLLFYLFLLCLLFILHITSSVVRVFVYTIAFYSDDSACLLCRLEPFLFAFVLRNKDIKNIHQNQTHTQPKSFNIIKIFYFDFHAMLRTAKKRREYTQHRAQYMNLASIPW